MIATLMGGLALATWFAMAGASEGDSPGVPQSTVTELGAQSAHYCVSDYAPNVAVTVHNERTGASASIHTNHRGSGCTDVPVDVDCGHLLMETIVAAGIAADGNPGTSSAQAKVPGNMPPCDPSSASSAEPTGGSRSFTGTDLAMVALGGAGCLLLGTMAVILVRRRRSSPAG